MGKRGQGDWREIPQIRGHRVNSGSYLLTEKRRFRDGIKPKIETMLKLGKEEEK